MIWFNSNLDGYKYLVPEYPCLITVKVMTAEGFMMLSFPTARHLYVFASWGRHGVSRKGVRKEWQQLCALSTMEVSHWGMTHSARSDWPQTRQPTMRRILLAKYGQHWDLATMLRNTGLEELVYLSPNPYWGRSKSGRGQNLLGTLTMDVRQALRLCPEQAEPEEVKASA